MIDRDALLALVPSPVEFARRLGLKSARRQAPRHDRVLVLCPWHSEKNASCNFVVRNGLLVAFCQSCRRGGDAFAIVAAVRGLDPRLDFREVATELAALVGVTLPEDERSAVRPRPVDPVAALARRIDAMAARYLTGKGLLDSDHRAVAAASFDDVLAALALLRAEDERHRDPAEDERRNRLLDAMPDPWVDTFRMARTA